jgi:hypothetical protein
MIRYFQVLSMFFVSCPIAQCSIPQMVTLSDDSIVLLFLNATILLHLCFGAAVQEEKLVDIYFVERKKT